MLIIQLVSRTASSLLSILIPQKCGEIECDIHSHFYPENNFVYFVLAFNFFTLFISLATLFVQVYREKYIHSHLSKSQNQSSNIPFKPFGNWIYFSPDLSLENNMTDYKKVFDRTVQHNNRLVIFAHFYIVVFILNLVLSSVVIFNMRYLDYKTITTFLICVLSNVENIANLATFKAKIEDKPVVLSSLNFERVVFNKIDKEYGELLDLTNLIEVPVIFKKVQKVEVKIDKN